MISRNEFKPVNLRLAFTLAALAYASGAGAEAQVCSAENTVTANVVALDQAFYTNRMGTIQSGGMIFALRRDVVSNNGSAALTPGNVMLRSGKRPRPMVLRVNIGQCLEVHFTNLLGPDQTVYDPALYPATVKQPFDPAKERMVPALSGNPQPEATFSLLRKGYPGAQPPTRSAGYHVMGLQQISIGDGSFVGANDTSLAQPGESITYKYFAPAEGAYLAYSTAADVGTNGGGAITGNLTQAIPGGQLSQGLFGAVTVQPRNAEWYRSQVTKEDLDAATYRISDFPADQLKCSGANCVLTRQEGQTTVTVKLVQILSGPGTGQLNTPDGHPFINYGAVYPAGATHSGKTPIPPNTPILKMLAGNREIVHSDLTAIITGPNAGRFAISDDSVDFRENPAYPDRRQPYREFAIHYHDDFAVTQAFPEFSSRDLQYTLGGGQDLFAINYGTGGIAAEILANRLGVGPMANCATCKFEEFFLSAWAVGDPAMVVDVPANAVGNTPMTVAGDLAGGTVQWVVNGTANPNNGTVTVSPGQLITFSSQAGTHGITFMNGAAAKQIFEFVSGTPLQDGTLGPGTWGTPAAAGPVLLAVMKVKDTVALGTTTKFECTQHKTAMAGVFAIGNSSTLQPGPKATKAFYPDDPSNVYHSYISDHVKFRILHAGMNLTHVHHQHAHQWLHSPNSDDSHYRDSQMISPGAGYTLDYVYGGSGNVNQTAGDSIFHCHFYPHFAEGMWSLWRVHDVFESGTQLNQDQLPDPSIAWTRALPDGEIAAGTPVPAIVPLPMIAMAPLPARVRIVKATSPDASVTKPVGYKIEVNPDDLKAGLNPGYPFFVPGIAGQRAPHPPLDFASENGNTYDGGLPRNVVLAEAGSAYEKHNRLDFSKDSDKLVAQQLPESGTPEEIVAMKAHSQRDHPSFTPGGMAGNFILNGLPPVSGAPFANPGIDPLGNPVSRVRRYKAANIQVDTVLNKKGWHNPQQRMISLWDDVNDTLIGTRPPQPFFFRANSGEVIEYWLANLVPNYYDLDDFQVRTPTDILGQHIHLVKFDVLASDGAANGFNYEDGTLSPAEVQEEIRAINKKGGIFTAGGQKQLTAKCIPFFGADRQKGPCPANWTGVDGAGNDVTAPEWVGAQATVQRWYADPLLNNKGEDRTLTTVFTHDHFGPSTHQQAGLYAGLLIEPQGSTWLDPVTGAQMGGRDDGGPTSWRADIHTAKAKESYREFAMAFADIQMAYTPFSISAAKPYTRYPTANPPAAWGWADPPHALFEPIVGGTPGPWPSIISDNIGSGTQVLNYRNEPLPFRSGKKVDSPVGLFDMSHIFQSIPRADDDLNRQPVFPMPINPTNPAGFKFPSNTGFEGAGDTDPFTPLLRAYEGDNVQIRTLAGAHLTPFSFTVHGVKWLFEPQSPNTGYRSTQGLGLSEHYEMHFTLPRTSSSERQTDYLYAPSSAVSGLDNGVWGIMRAYRDLNQATLKPLPSNLHPETKPAVANVCPAEQPQDQIRRYEVVALMAKDALPGKKLIYNSRGKADGSADTAIQDPLALMYFQRKDLDCDANLTNCKLKAGRSQEPLVLRANAGDCIKVQLFNRLPGNETSLNPGMVMANTGVSQTITYTLPPYTGPDVSTMIVDLNKPCPAPVGSKGNCRTYTKAFADFVNNNPYGFKILPPSGSIIKPLNNGGWCVGPCAGAKAGVPDQSLYIAKSGGCDGGAGSQPPCVLDLRIYPIALNSSHEVGLHPQLVSYDFAKSNGVNIGLNKSATVPPGGYAPFEWYAGTIEERDGAIRHVPMEFGAINLTPSDPLMQHNFGLIGALIVEPKGSTWKEDQATATMAVVRKSDKSLFRELVAIHQDDLASLENGGTSQAINYRTEPLAYRFANPNWDGNIQSKGQALTIEGDVAGGSVKWVLNGAAQDNNSKISIIPGQKITFSVKAGKHGLTFMNKAAALQVFDITATPGVPFGDDPPGTGKGTWGTAGQTAPTILATLTVKNNIPASVKSVKFECSVHLANMAGEFQIGQPFTPIDAALSNRLVLSDPQTPVFSAAKGMPVRFRMLHPAGQFEHVPVLHGANWQEEPYIRGSSELGHNPLSQSTGSRDNFGANVAFDMLIGKAGGPAEVATDYLYRSFVAGDLGGGLWSLFRVGERDKDTVTITKYQSAGPMGVVIAGTNTVKLSTNWDDPDIGHFVKDVAVSLNGAPSVTAQVDPITGAWQATMTSGSGGPIKVTSSYGGTATASTFIIPAQILNAVAAPGAKQEETPPPDRFTPQTSRAK